MVLQRAGAGAFRDYAGYKFFYAIIGQRLHRQATVLATAALLVVSVAGRAGASRALPLFTP
jgi:hypothetical protein